MNTTPTNPATDENTGAGTGTGRLLHLLEHPEEHDRDGEHIDQARSRAMNALRMASLQQPPKVGSESQQAITTKLLRSAQPTRTT